MTYCGNFIYEDSSLKRILVDGGYIENGTYYFYLTDHLGNNRVVANAGGTVVQTNHYYPYGMTFTEGSSPNLQPYKFGGKEKENWKDIGSFDFGARIYHPALGEFGQGNPLAEKYYSVSPYVYCKGNPINRVAPDGRWDVTVHVYKNRSEYGYGVAVGRQKLLLKQILLKSRWNIKFPSKR
jgi:RHS repeat-associated protein